MRAALVNCHFGKLPSWLPYFIKSASTVKCADFYIMTDDNIDSYNSFCKDHGFDNVIFKAFSVEQLETIVSEKTSTIYKLPEVRKICDWKTAYNFLFTDTLITYKYWGHCDLDIIMGDLDSYLSPLLGNFDIISGDRNRLCGPFNLYSNHLGDVFKLHPSWQRIMLEMSHVAYDEIGLDSAVKMNKNISVCYGVSNNRYMQNYGSPHLQPPLRIPATWRNGKLTIDEDNRETMFIHMGHKKEIVNVKFNNENFRINKHGFS